MHNLWLGRGMCLDHWEVGGEATDDRSYYEENFGLDTFTCENENMVATL